MQATLRQANPSRGTSSPGEGRRPGAGRCLPAPARLRGGGSHTLLPSLPAATRPWSCGKAQRSGYAPAPGPAPGPGPAPPGSGGRSPRQRRAPCTPQRRRCSAPSVPPPGTYFPEPLTPITTTSTMAARRALPLPLCPPAPPPRPALGLCCGAGAAPAPPPAPPPPRAAARDRHPLPFCGNPHHPCRVPRSPAPQSLLVLKLPDLLPNLSLLSLYVFSLDGRFS